MKDVNGKISYNGKEYTLVFNLNVMESIQDKYGSLSKWWELTDGSASDIGEPNIKATVFGITEMINEGIDIENDEKGTDNAFLTVKQVGRMISAVGIANANSVMNDIVVKSTESAEKNE